MAKDALDVATRKLNNKTCKAAVQRLDEYIRKYERKYGTIWARYRAAKPRLKSLRIVEELMEVIEKEERGKRAAFRNLKASNRTIKNTIIRLNDSTTLFNVNIEPDLGKSDSPNTERLLEVNSLAWYN
ncbi:hypothetical protein KM043_005908 [Ampulex compressa]|nr:hypothetical protein KM043_005908 [Ampulex compressa]